jgi:hypothetical protein
MQKLSMTIVAIFLITLFTSCASQKQVAQGEMDVKKPINCAYAEGDIRALQSEKTTAAEQMATGITTIVPVGLVASAVQGKTGTDAKVATGDYNKMLDDKIAEIKMKCGVK